MSCGSTSGVARPGTKTSSTPLGEGDHRHAALDERPQRSRARRRAGPCRRRSRSASGSAAKLSSRRVSCGERSACARTRAMRRASTSSIEAKSSGRRPAQRRGPEAAVVGLLRRAALEDDHRGDRVVAAEVGDVEALDPHRQLVQLERLAQVARAPRPGCWRRCSAPQPVLVEREPRRCARPARGSGACRRARRRAPRPGCRAAR